MQTRGCKRFQIDL